MNKVYSERQLVMKNSQGIIGAMQSKIAKYFEQMIIKFKGWRVLVRQFAVHVPNLQCTLTSDSQNTECSTVGGSECFTNLFTGPIVSTLNVYMVYNCDTFKTLQETALDQFLLTNC